jgi:hypothetical protein
VEACQLVNQKAKGSDTVAHQDADELARQYSRMSLADQMKQRRTGRLAKRRGAKPD